MWAAACTRLESQGVTPGIYRTVLMPSGSVPGRNPVPMDDGKTGAMASLLARMPGGSGDMQVGVGNAAVAMGSPMARAPVELTRPEFEQALARLDELLRHLPATTPGTATSPDAMNALAKRLDAHRAALLASTSAPVERQIIELLSRTGQEGGAERRLQGR